MNYYEQFKYSYLPVLKGKYASYVKNNDYEAQDKIKNIIFKNKRLKQFQKEEFWNIIQDKGSVYGWD